jgi:hypothetical protein
MSKLAKGAVKNIFSNSQTSWLKHFLALGLFLMGCGSVPDTDPPIDPIPEGCPNNIQNEVESCDDTLKARCRFDSSGQISANRSDPIYKCVKVYCVHNDCSFWIMLAQD